MLKELIAPFIQQTNFPAGWYWYQFFFGGHQEKIETLSNYFQDNKKIIEVGCSVGNISHVFEKFKNVEYLGIDLDKNVVRYAKKHFAKKNFNFEVIDFKKINKKYDYVLFSGLFHHIDDDLVVDYMSHAKKLLTHNGKIVVYDPVFGDNDPLFYRLFEKYLEVGKWVRRPEPLKRLILKAGGLKIEFEEEKLLSTFFKFPVVGRMRLYILKVEGEAPS